MKRFLKIAAIFMVVILVIGSFSALFSNDTGKPTGPGTVVNRPTSKPCECVDMNDDGLCDNCGEACEDGQDVFGGTVINEVDFSGKTCGDLYYAPNVSELNRRQDGFSVGGLKSGTATTENGYLKYSTSSADESMYSDVDSFIALYACKESMEGSEVGVDTSTFDYLMIDFDVWTDSTFFDGITFRFQGANASGSTVLCEAPYLRIINNAGSAYIASSDLEGTPLYTITAPSEKLHITYVFKMNLADGELASSRIYINGEYVCEYLSKFNSDMQFLKFVRVYFSKGFAKADRSVCFDDFQVSTFGTGNADYDKAISSLFDDSSLSLTECADSVLYSKKK